MPDLPKKKVGIVACSGEEMAEGTVTRLAALKVLEQVRPTDTVTICLPLFLAGGEGDRAFARFYPTIAVDGCGKRCAARATERFSGKPAASIVVTDGIGGDTDLGSARRLSERGLQMVDTIATAIASQVDDLLENGGMRSEIGEVQEATESACACGSGLPVLTLSVGHQRVTLIAVPAIFDQFYAQGKHPDIEGVADELLQTTGLYNPIPATEAPAYRAILLREYERYCRKKEA